MTFIERLVRAASPEKPACIAGDQELTYGDLSRFAEDHAREMRELKGRGNVALLLPNSLDYVQWYMTVLHAGHVVVPIGWNTTAYEVANTINRFDIGMVITRQEIIQAMENREFEHDFAYICTDTGLRGHIGGTGREIPDTGAPEDVVLMLGTSGSTQSPKKVMLTERNLLINGQDIIESLRYRPDERFLVVLPLTYAAANESQWIVSLLLGATVALYTGPLYPANLYRTIRDQRITSLTAVPSLLRVLLQSGAHQTISAPSLRTLCFGGGPSDTRTLEQASRVYRELNIVHMYGLTEATTRVSHLTGQDFHQQIGSVGKPIGGIEVKIADESGAGVPPKTSGEILVKGGNVMKGYYRQEEQTKQAIRDGWLWTGDIGWQDQSGYLYITGRKSNKIIYSGMNIYPEEIEEVIFRSGLVKDVFVYGVSNAWKEEVLTADILPLAPAEPPSALTGALKRYMEGNLPPYKIPAVFRLVDTIEKTSNGKTRRTARACQG